MSRLEETGPPTLSQSIGSRNPFIPSGTSPRSSSPENHTSTPPLSSASFMKSFKSSTVLATQFGTSEGVALPRCVKMTPTMKVMGKGKGLKVTTFTQYEAFPQLVDVSIPSKEFNIDTTQSDETPIIMVTRSAGLVSFPVQSKKSKVKAYTPKKSLGYREGHKLKQMIEKENDDIFEDASVEPQSCDEANAKFDTAPSTPVRCLSVAGIRDVDGPYDDKPRFPTGTTIQDFGTLPDHLRGPCFEVSPRTSVLDGPSAIPNINKLLSMNMDDEFVRSSLLRPLEVVPEALTVASPDVAENFMGQSDGPASVPALVPNVGGDSPIPELPVDPLNKDKKNVKRRHKAIDKFRSGVRKSRYRCLRTPVLVVLVGKELSKPTRMAIENIACGLPSGLGDVTPLPA